MAKLYCDQANVTIAQVPIVLASLSTANPNWPIYDTPNLAGPPSPAFQWLEKGLLHPEGLVVSNWNALFG